MQPAVKRGAFHSASAPVQSIACGLIPVGLQARESVAAQDLVEKFIQCAGVAWNWFSRGFRLCLGPARVSSG